MACGDRYRSLVRTAGGGTLDDLGCTLGMCGPDDFSQWRDTADQWHRHVESAWSAMQAAADKSSKAAPPDELYAELLSYQNEWRALPDGLLTAVFETGELGSSNFFVEKLRSNVVRATCLRERLEDETRRLGGAQPPAVTRPAGQPSTTTTGSAWPWVLGAGVLAGGYLVYRIGRAQQ